MDIDFKNSTLKIGIRDFVSFSQNSYPTTPAQNLGNWRTTLGTEWHQQLWRETEQLYGANARSEIRVSGSIKFLQWSFELSGRIDQIIQEDDQVTLREVKTTRQILPQPLDALRQIYPDYFEQLACYQLLLPDDLLTKTLPLHAELLMLHIDTGIRQFITLDREPMEILKPRMEAWIDFLEGQRETNNRVRHLVVPSAFEDFREDQLPVRELLFRQFSTHHLKAKKKPFIALEAATGFGKTSIAIEWALQGIKKEHFDRIIYLTGKNTGQKQVVDELNRFQSMSEGIRYYQIRNREQHYTICPHLGCPCQQRKDSKQQLESYIPFRKVETMIRNGSPDLETIGLNASTYNVCPRLISQTALTLSEFWIADYNYIFSPIASGFLDSIISFEPERTLLILDETHNLHDRICSNFSTHFTRYQGEQVLSALRDIRAPKSLLGGVDGLIRFLDGLEARKTLDTTNHYHLSDILETTHRQITENGRTLLDLPESVVDILWNLATAWQSIQNKQLETLTWCPQKGVLNITCVDASQSIRETLGKFAKALFMSATFPTPDLFEKQTGIHETQCLRISAESDWRKDCYTVAIDTRVHTTYNNRERYFRKTAQTLIRLCECDSDPVLAFFPSYHYAATIAQYMDVMAPHLRAFTMERALNPADQIAAIEASVRCSDVLLLPLGSGLSEGIDILGGRIHTVVVVSPALPEVNPVQDAKTQKCASSRDGFRQVYQIPGMTKVNQALGRIVRNPAHRARVVLHCKRFAEADYHALLAPEYQEASILKNDADFEKWLMRQSH